MAYKTVWEPNGILWHYFGTVTAEEIAQANDEFFMDFRSKGARYQIIDTMDMDELVWQQHEIVETSANDVGASMAVNGLKIAFVVNGNQDIIEKISAYIELCKDMDASWSFRMFPSMDAARDWVQE